MNTEKIIAQLDEIYGKGKGMGVYTAIMSGIVSDFTGMLKKARAGVMVKEEYRMEDGKAIVYVLVTKRSNGRPDINIDIKKL